MEQNMRLWSSNQGGCGAAHEAMEQHLKKHMQYSRLWSNTQGYRTEHKAMEKCTMLWYSTWCYGSVHDGIEQYMILWYSTRAHGAEHNTITGTSEWSLCGDHVNCFCVGIFHKSAGKVKYPYQKQWAWSPQMITTNLFLFLCHTTIDWILILMVYVYNVRMFTGETANIIIWRSNT